MNIILASLKCLPKLVEGKVAVINDDGTYSLYNPSRYCTIEDNFDPLRYSILVSKKWSKCIIYSTTTERETFLVNEQIRSLRKLPVYKVGDKIHIHSRRGIYELVDIQGDMLIITCKKWQYEDKKTHTVHKNDFQCLAGGLHNIAF